MFRHNTYNINKVFITSLILLSALPALAQVNHNPQAVYEQAERDYNQGNFTETENELLSVVKSLKGMYKTSAYRMLALCQLEAGDVDEAKSYVDLLLKSDPYYTPTLNDPQRLIDLITDAKSQSAGITTASRQAESVDEAPVPVTLITEEMIRFSGATSLSELLCLYVPGMSKVEGLEENIAMHGIYGLSQDKILILQDGHRLNGSSTNAEAPDFRNSLDKIKQIEVLRGPASSLYGNVALTAVVNIITRKGAVLNGGRISALAGSQKTYSGSFVVGGGNNVVDVLGWGSLNSTQGFKHVISNVNGGKSTLYSNGFNDRPAYDVGIKAKWGEFSMTVNSQRAKKTPYVNVLQISATQDIGYSAALKEQMPATMGYYIMPTTDDYNMVQNYNVDRYSKISSNGPGITRTNHHINLDYTHSFGNVDFSASGYVSMENTSFYNVMGDSVSYMIGAVLLQSLQGTSGSAYTQNMSQAEQQALLNMYVKTSGVFQVMEWENITMGGQAQATTKYNWLGHGTAMLGAQYEHFALTNGTLFLGGNYTTDQMISSGRVFDDGNEDLISVYGQLKHYFSDDLILNAGLRYDHKARYDGAHLNHLSPRGSLIYKFSDYLSARASYNYSFVDAPFIYRACAVALFSGGKDMKPEKMNSLQLGLSYHKPSKLQAEASIFYNSLSDLITENIAMTNGYLFHNAGRVKQTGVDLSAQYTASKFFVSANATWQQVLTSEEYNVYKSNRYGIPKFMTHVVAAYSPYSGTGTGSFWGGRLWVNLNANLQTKTYYQVVDVLTTFANKSYHGKAEKVDPKAIIGLGATYEWKKLDFNLTLKNITNDEFMVGSLMSDGIPNSGRQILGKVTVKF